MSFVDNEITQTSILNMQMPSTVRKLNMEARAKQILQLALSICSEQPIKLDLDLVFALKEPVDSYNLSWIIGVCQKNYQFFGQIEPRDMILTPLVDHIHDQLKHVLRTEGTLLTLKPHWIDEVDQRGSECVEKKCCYQLPVGVLINLINLLKQLPQFSYLFYQNSIHTSIMTTKYTSNTINNTVVDKILPLLLPSKKIQSEEKSALCWACFQLLPSILKEQGFQVICSEEKNKKDSTIQIDGQKKYGYDAFRKQFDGKLLPAYLTAN